jgi:hypothetical protein
MQCIVTQNEPLRAAFRLLWFTATEADMSEVSRRSFMGAGLGSTALALTGGRSLAGDSTTARYGTGSAEQMRAAEHIYRAWDEAYVRKDLDASMALYSQDATLESALVRSLLHSDTGIIQGRDNLRRFVTKVYAQTPPARQHYRTGYFTDGSRLIWEYPRITPTGQQIDLIESMEIENGLIRRHCVYWGWYGVKTLEEGP